MKTIRLAPGKTVIVDDEDYPIVMIYHWRVYKQKSKYVALAAGMGMHRLVMKANKGDKVEHINGNGLDNRRQNLKLITKTQLSQMRIDQKLQKEITYYGVRVNDGAYTARVPLGGGRTKYLGPFNTAEDAARAYDRALIKRFNQLGIEPTKLNFPDR